MKSKRITKLGERKEILLVQDIKIKIIRNSVHYSPLVNVLIISVMFVCISGFKKKKKVSAYILMVIARSL